MLVLTRKAGERIHIGDNIVVTIVRLKRGGRTVIGIEAPRDVCVHRHEVYERIQEADVDESSDNE